MPAPPLWAVHVIVYPHSVRNVVAVPIRGLVAARFKRYPKGIVLVKIACRPHTQGVAADAAVLPFADQSFECAISVYAFEHFRDLRNTLIEVRRILKPQGSLLVAIPAEGGFLYNLGRRFSSKPYIERKYGIDYDAIVRWEHWNTFKEVMDELKNIFELEEVKYIPFSLIKSPQVNIIGCIKVSMPK